ncbi:ATP-dependent DNA ligase [Terriglobus aquaticus]|uniref:DNA ligase n=1 Tax=Terriglobus aquaticus TaxID=940139 RepID=A0ABW9KQ34_9BACT|nr:ATP-dependent DNA ligase [Terriglobus aquaticus]
MSLYLPMAQLADELAATSSKLKKRAAIAAGLLAARDAGTAERGEAEDGLRDAGLFAMYLAGTPFAEFDARKLSIGGAMMSRVIRDIVNPTDAEFTAAFRRYGDLGAATGDLWAEKGHTPAPSLTYAGIAESFAEIAVAKTTAIRQQLLTDLLRIATPVEAKYLVKLMLGDMRIGVKQALIEEAVAVASEQPLEAVRNAITLEADLADAVRKAFQGRLAEARMRLFHPLGFMLASPVDTPEEAVKRFSAVPEPEPDEAAEKPKKRKKKVAAAEADVPEQPVEENAPADSNDPVEREQIALDAVHIDAQIEDKYDGMRVQLHCGDASQPGRVALYSRNREDVTVSYPEIAEAFARVTPEVLGDASGSGLILDGEVLAWDVREHRALPFAVLSPRIGRKRVTNDVRRGTPVVFMCFDILFAGGSLLLDLPLRERRQRLQAVVNSIERVTCSPLETPAPMPKGGLFVDDGVSKAQGEQRLLLSEVRHAASAEDLDRAYVSARDRGNEGVMIKALSSAYQPGRRGISWVKLKRTLDTLDVVITGAEYGNGRKSQFLSDYTFAVRDADGLLKNVGKAYSGVTDAEIAELTEWLKAHTLEDYGHFRTVEPLMILEVAFNNIMRSDRHASGFALRFPRILQIRRDKPLDEIDTVARVEEIYQSQPDKPVETAEASQQAS